MDAGNPREMVEHDNHSKSLLFLMYRVFFSLLERNASLPLPQHEIMFSGKPLCRENHTKCWRGKRKTPTEQEMPPDTKEEETRSVINIPGKSPAWANY